LLKTGCKNVLLAQMAAGIKWLPASGAAGNPYWIFLELF